MSMATQCLPKNEKRTSVAAASMTPSLLRITQEDAIGQLRRRDGSMAQLGADQDMMMLDWVDAVPRILADPEGPERVEDEARQLIARGIRHVIWSGMGGSVLSVQVLRALGFGAAQSGVTIYPLDSTDPAALNTLLRTLADAKGISLPPSDSTVSREDAEDERALCRALFTDVAMIGVAMGITSEEPISHLQWFAELLRTAQLPISDHQLVMSIPDSYLDHYALTHAVPRLPLQLDGGVGTPGRMSAPATRVFLLPVALDLASRGAARGSLRAILRRAWQIYDLDGATTDPAHSPYVQLAATLSDAAHDGACALFTAFGADLDPLRWWLEQLMEESLGKGDKGVIVFADLPLVSEGAWRSTLGGVRLRITSAPEEPTPGTFTISEPLLGSADPDARLAGLAATFLGLQLCMALFAYLQGIRFAGQPAVEAYKSRARALRATSNDPVAVGASACVPISAGRLTLLPPPGDHPTESPAEAIARIARRATYFDLTINGELTPAWRDVVAQRLSHVGAQRLGVPVKLRRAPAAYHSTEQSEMDGPGEVVSLRVLALASERTLLGSYDATFLRAQAIATWMAMNEHHRTCMLLLYDGTDDDLGPVLCDMLEMLAQGV